MASTESPATRMYVHRRFVIRFLVTLLVLLSIASFVSIALGLGATTDTTSQEDSATPTRLADTNPFYVLLIGSDSLEGTALYTGNMNSRSETSQAHADGLILARIDPGTCTVTLVTVPANTVLEDSGIPVRDTLVEGPKATVHTVERITGVSIRYYFLLGFSGFEALVSQVGPIDADVPVSITMQDPLTARPITIPTGKHVELDEAGTLAYIRSSEPYLVDSDAHRQLNARTVVSDMITMVLGSEDDAVRKVLGVFESEVETNIDNATLLSLVTRFYDEKEAVRIFSCTGPYLASSINEAGEPIVEPRVTAWRELMSVVDSGEDPAAALPHYDFQGSEDDYVKEPYSVESSSSTIVASASTASSSGSGKASSSSAAASSKAKKD
ncbi:MAG: LytR family transcriptional regulator [Coriobacteriaceae bacterium]|nr:LytR family transcriptional regulator [Coriobacteriaceae bacterium]